MSQLVPAVNILEPEVERIIEFKGLDRKIAIDDGEMSDMLNMTSDSYPLLCPRALRGKYMKPPDAVKPLQIMQRFERIAMIAKDSQGNVNFYYHLTKVANVTGLTADTRMVAINTKICFFPQKTYVEIVRSGSMVTTGDFGSLDAESTLTDAVVTLPASAYEDARITLPSGHGFGYDDTVLIEGTLTYTASGALVPVQAQLNTSVMINVDENDLLIPREVISELTGDGATGITLTGTVSRKMPTLDHIIEWNNRLWGASNVDNTIYACKLGDPKNWQYYQGTSMDSYYAMQGSDEDWTGCAGYSNHLIFFKPNSILRIYGTAPSNYQITNTQGYGVEEGSSRSVCTINDKIFYKSALGIMAYEGGNPYCISDKFNVKFHDVIAGTEGRKYYASIAREDGDTELLVLDIDLGLWHREDDVRFRGCCTMDGRLYFINDAESGVFDEDEVYIINPENAFESQSDMPWRAVFGPFDEYLEERKIYSKLTFRLVRQADTEVRFYISINEGEWELVAEYTDASTGGDYIPIVPRRCDRYSVKVEGTGACAIKTLTRRYRRGTGGRL